MTEYICASDVICVDQTCASPKNETSIWNGLKQFFETVGGHIVEIYRCNNDTQPKFENGGARVIIRPGRIDLV